MKAMYLIRAACLVALPAFAQVAPPAVPAGQAVASPYRAQADAIAARGSQDTIEPDSHRGALQVVDAQGRLLGRLEGADLSRDFAVTVVYRGELATVALGPAYAGIPYPAPNGGLSWPPFQSLFHTSSDCSGDPYLPPASHGTDYFGLGLTENGRHFILFGDMRQATQVQLGSIYDIDHQQCNQTNAAILAVPVQASKNIDRIAVPPFYVR
jgi:hypothetical protein